MNESCETTECHLRHQKDCKFFSSYQRCKFGDTCEFVHRESEMDKVLKALTVKLDTLESEVKLKVDEMERIAKAQQTKIDTLEKMLENAKIKRLKVMLISLNKL